MTQSYFLLITLAFLSSTIGDELTACDEKACSCSVYSGRGITNMRCPDLVNCTVDIDYKKSDYLEIECLNDAMLIDELNFNFGQIERILIKNCKLPRGLNIFEKWNLTDVKEVIFKRMVDFGTDGVIQSNFFDKVPKGSIERLHMNSCGIKAVKDGTFKGFVNLTRLDFEGNDLTEVLDVFKDIPLLRELDLQQNSIRDLPDGITAPYLKTLYLNSNKITSLKGGMFDGCSNLTLLELSDNQIGNISNVVLRPLKELQAVSFGLRGDVNITELFMENRKLSTVKFRGGNITLISPEAFKNLPRLQLLFIYDSKLRTLPKDLLKYNGNIKTILISENDLTDLPEGIFENLNNLIKLDLSSNKLTQWKKEYFRNGLKNLKELKLNKNKLETIPSGVFTDLKKLETLSLSNNKIREISRTAFDPESSLKQLYLNVNNLSNDDDESFNFLTNLDVLELNNNSYDAIPATTFTLQTLSMRNNKVIEVVALKDILGMGKIDLTGNNVKSVDFLLFDVATQNESRQTPRVLILKNNPFACDCTAYDFVEWLSKDDLRLRIVTDGLNCFSPPEFKSMPVRNVTFGDLKCDLRSMMLEDKYKCPDQCKCELYPVNATLHVDCSELNLTSVPDINMFKLLHAHGISRENVGKLYKNVFVDLSGNNIRNFTEKLNYSYVTGLDLSRNGLESIKWIPQNIEILKLHANKLSHINDKVLLALKNDTSLKMLSLHGNPWSCDCSLVNLTNAVRNNFRYLLEDSNKVQCNDGHLLIHKTKTELCKVNQIFLILLVILIVTFLVIAIITLIFYYKYETTVKIWLYSHNILLPFINEEDFDKNKRFDAFVSYSHKDESFIEQHLLPELEGGLNPFKLCYHERDWEVGEFINQQIIDSVNNSRRTIIVLSKNFLESTWAPIEFRTAYTQAMNEKLNRLIIILYDDVKPDEVNDEELKTYLKTNTYIKWGDPWFWKKLKYAMPHRNVKGDEKMEKTKQRIENIMISIDDKLDLTMSPATPNTQTPPAMSLDPLLLKVSPLEFKTEKSENKIIATQIC